MTTTLPITFATTAIVLTGFLHGLWSDRWHFSDKPDAAAARLEKVPMVIGDWEGHPVEVDPRQLGHLAGHWCRRYVNRQNQSSVTVALVCGRPGPVAIHTPDVCYGSSGYEVARPTKYTFTSASLVHAAEFCTARFAKPKSLDPVSLRIYWSWNAGRGWAAPDSPRLAFASYPVLYKLYFVREMASPKEAIDDDPTLGFMEQLLPELERTLFPSPAAS
jgi:hypothetical protein